MYEPVTEVMQIQPLGRHVRTEEQPQRILQAPETLDNVLLLGIGELTVHDGDLLVVQAQVALALTVQPAQGFEALGEHHHAVCRIAQGPPALGRLQVRQQPLVLTKPKLLPTGFLEIEVTIETGGDDKERHLQFKALRGDRMNRLR